MTHIKQQKIVIITSMAMDIIRSLIISTALDT